MKTFKRDKLEDMIRHVIKLQSNAIVQEKNTGNSLSVFEELSDANKRQVIKTFCDGREGPFQVLVGSER